MSIPSLRSHLLIVADDLTGAADSGARGRAAGLRARVLLDAADWPPVPDLTPVVAVSTDSRHLSAEQAAARVHEAVARAPSLPEAIWYKKIDSTLRGNLGAELDALLDHLGTGMAVVAPAFPAQNRGVEDGYLVHPEAAPRQVHLATRLRQESRRTVAEIHLPTVRRSADALAAAMARAREEGAQVLAVDAMTEEDLAAVVDAAQAALPTPLFCGSAGLVGALAANVNSLDQGTPPPLPSAAGPILGVVGSGSHMAHAQIAQVTHQAVARTRVLDRTGSSMDLVGAGNTPAGDWLIHLAPPPPGLELEGPTARAEAARLADLTRVIVRRLNPNVLIVVGGDTATYVMHVLGIRELEIVEELLPGIPLMVGLGPDTSQRLVVFKAGNFGDEGTLAQLYTLLHARQPTASPQ